MQTKQLFTALVLCPLLLAGCAEPEEIPIKYDIDTQPGRLSAALKAFDSCDVLEESFKSSLRNEMRVRLLSIPRYAYVVNGKDYDAAATEESSNSSSELVAGVDYSGTNNQEAGVDEADFVKTDGNYIYALNAGRLEILAVPEFGQLEQAGRLAIQGWPRSMLLAKGADKDRAVIFSEFNTGDGMAADGPVVYFERYSPRTKITVVDISDRQNPTVEKELYLEGELAAARLVEGTVRLVNYSWLDNFGLQTWLDLDYEALYNLDVDSVKYKNIFNQAVNEAIEKNEKIIAGLTLEDFIPRMAIKDPAGKWQVQDFTSQDCQDFQMSEDGVARGINSIFTMDLLSSEISYNVNHIVADYSVVYASGDNLILAEPAQAYWWYWQNSDEEEATNIHRFDISTKGQTVYTGSVRIPGTINNQFSLSEYEGVVRAAVTTGNWQRWWLDETQIQENRIYTLGGSKDNFAVLGQVGGIAPGEEIYSARFVEDKGYLVTFHNTDPLWTIDLSDARNPKVIGELQVPGVSTYIHPLDGGSYLLTVGYGGNDEGLNWLPQVTLFDVRDFSQPLQLATLTVGLDDYGADDYWSWSSSSALYEHKAFNYWAPADMLAIPVSSESYHYADNNSYWDYLSLLDLITVDTSGGQLKLKGAVDHSALYKNLETAPYWGYDIQRSIFMGTAPGYIYAISPAGITCHKIDTLQMTSRITF